MIEINQKDEFSEAQFYVFDNSYFQEGRYKDIFQRFLNNNPELNILQKNKQQLHLNSLAGLLNFVTNQLNIQVNLQFTQINFIKLCENLYYDKHTFRILNIYNSNPEEPCLFRNFKTQTSGGTRLLRANLLQPLCQIDKIIERQSHLQELLQFARKDKNFIKNLRELLKKFKFLDSISLQLSQVHIYKKIFEERCNQTKVLLEQILQVQEQLKNINNLCTFFFSYNMEGYFTEQLYSLVNDDEPTQISKIIQSNFDQNVLTSIQQECNTINKKKEKKENNEHPDEKILYLIKNDDNKVLIQARKTYTQLMTQRRNLEVNYRKLLKIDEASFKVIHKVKETIIGLKNGYMLSIPQKSNITEQAIRKRLTTEYDSVQIIETKGGQFHVLTDNIADFNLRLQQCKSSIFDQTSLCVFQLYVSIQQESSGWIFRVNKYISYLDLLLSFADYARNFENNTCFPVFEQNGVIKLEKSKSVYISSEKRLFSIEIGNESNFHLIYDLKDRFQGMQLQFAQTIILAQIGCMVPCQQYKMNCYSHLLTKLRGQSLQSLCENQSSFTSELKSIQTILQRIQNQQSQVLVLCDEMILSSSHEENIALNLVFIERIDSIIRHKETKILCLTNQADNILAQKLSQNIQVMIADNQEVVSLSNSELETVLNNEKSHQYNKDYIERLQYEVNLPEQLCRLVGDKLLAQQQLISQKTQLESNFRLLQLE